MGGGGGEGIPIIGLKKLKAAVTSAGLSILPTLRENLMSFYK